VLHIGLTNVLRRRLRVERRESGRGYAQDQSREAVGHASMVRSYAKGMASTAPLRQSPGSSARLAVDQRCAPELTYDAACIS
jgi:hypothetical protein